MVHLPMGWKSTLRATGAQERRAQRDAQKRQRELERRAKEQAKLSALEQARLEVETYDNRLEVLLSLHKEQGEPWNWITIAGTLPPAPPKKYYHHELRAKQLIAIDFARRGGPPEAVLEQACLQDEGEYKAALQSHSEERAEWEKLTSLAHRILAADYKAYTEALVELNPMVEISSLGSSIHFAVHTAKLIECTLKVNGVSAIPTDVKSLTAAGKVSVKAMPRGRFHEIYQDYVCGCVLRVAREVFALLPVETVLVTASADWLDSGTGRTVERPVLSVAIDREVINRLIFDQLDPSDTIETLPHRGDFKASRKSGVFQPIEPLTPAAVPQSLGHSTKYEDLFARARRLREELQADITTLRSPTARTM